MPNMMLTAAAAIAPIASSTRSPRSGLRRSPEATTPLATFWRMASSLLPSVVSRDFRSRRSPGNGLPRNSADTTEMRVGVAQLAAHELDRVPLAAGLHDAELARDRALEDRRRHALRRLADEVGGHHGADAPAVRTGR